MHEAFQRAIRPEASGVRVLRLTLQPMTLGHLFLLDEIGSPLVTGEACHDLGPLTLTALVLSQRTAAEAWQVVRFAMLAPAFLLRVWGWRCRKLDLYAEGATLAEHFNLQMARPATCQSSGSSTRKLGAPWAWVLLDFLMSSYRMSKQAALDTPMLTASALWAANSDAAGRIELTANPSSIGGTISRLTKKARGET